MEKSIRFNAGFDDRGGLARNYGAKIANRLTYHVAAKAYKVCVPGGVKRAVLALVDIDFKSWYYRIHAKPADVDLAPQISVPALVPGNELTYGTQAKGKVQLLGRGKTENLHPVPVGQGFVKLRSGRGIARESRKIYSAINNAASG